MTSIYYAIINVKRSIIMKKKIFDIIQIGDKSNVLSKIFDYFIVFNIFFNITALILETFEELNSFSEVFKAVEIITTLIFLIEYILRIYTADLLYPEKSQAKAIFRFIFSFDGIVDLFTIIPVFFLSGFVVFRILRVIRIFHLFRINTQSDSFNIITKVLYNKKNQIIYSLIIIMILMLAGSLCMYSVEHEAQPEVFKNAFSGIWWTASAVLTIGYGDICPVTTLGKVLAIFISFLGVGAVAIPTGILSAGFVEQYSKESHKKSLVDLNSIGEVLITKGHEYEGLTPYEIRKNYNMKVYLILRDNLTIIPTDDVILLCEDIIFIHSGEFNI